jgi:hypothetical protein
MNRLANLAAACAATLGLVLAASCGDSTGPNSTRDVNGNWTLAATYNSAQLQTTCTLNGSVSIAQTGTTFTGQVSGSVASCTGPGGTTSGSGDGPITGGQISGNTLSYSDVECTYTGTISGSPANRVDGSVSCNVAIGGTTYPFNGTWQISR